MPISVAQRTLAACVSFVVAALLLLGSMHREAAAEEADVAAPLGELLGASNVAGDLRRLVQQKDGPDEKRSAALMIGSVKTAATRASGTTWERACYIPYPDPKVVVVKRGKQIQTHTTAAKRDVCSATYNEMAFTVEEGDTLHVRVIDEDCLCDDLIGELNVQVSDAMIAAGVAEWSFGQVLSLRVKFTSD